MVELGRVSRSSFYRFDDGVVSRPDPHMDLRDAIQRIALAWPSYGRPRITAELRRQEWTVNPKLVYRLMREDNLLCVRKRKFAVTTDSNHTRKVYPNLAPDIILTAPDQLWRADITYIRLREEFVFLAVILDAYSRRVIGWALDRTMEDERPPEQQRRSELKRLGRNDPARGRCAQRVRLDRRCAARSRRDRKPFEQRLGNDSPLCGGLLREGRGSETAAESGGESKFVRRQSQEPLSGGA